MISKSSLDGLLGNVKKSLGLFYRVVEMAAGAIRMKLPCTPHNNMPSAKSPSL